MLAIYKKEVKSYFTTMTGYVFIAFLALVVGYVFYMINVKSSYAWIGETLEYSYVSIVFMILVPVMTMKIFADERHTKTDQMLFTAPVTVTQIVWGKYLAAVTVFLVNIGIICLYPLFMSDYGEIPFAASYCAIFGFFLMGATYFAIGLFISSITENQIISAVVTFAVLLLSFMMQYMTGIVPGKALPSAIIVAVCVLLVAAIYYLVVRNTVDSAPMITAAIAVIGILAVVIVYVINSSLFEGLIEQAMLHLSISYMYGYFFETEVLDINGIIYFVSLIGLFLFLTVQSVQKRRWS
ncbi:MAG: ABC transporter permease [Lachnospiraceae bacterium]|nr:ABC transporter permease [Lachnospiraceae bacterium]